MTAAYRATKVLSKDEIRLIKGLLQHQEHFDLNQQKIIAHFSFPERTVHHNVVSDIARGQAGTNDADYPAVNLGSCRYFLENWTGERCEHDRFVRIAVATDPISSLLKFSFRFHPVGQGLFCSGHFERAGQQPFRWVYDCGTEAGRTSYKRAQHVKNEIDILQADLGANHLDLVTLSHFDEDHLSGMLDLLEKFTVGTLLLPHLTPWERLVVAVRERAAVGSDFMSFLVAPTAFLMQRMEGRIERILLVPSSSGEQADDPVFPPDTSGYRDEPEKRPRPEFQDSEPTSEDRAAGLGHDTGLANPRVRVLKVGGSISVSNAWEFVPYNDKRLAQLADPMFRRYARPLAMKFKQARNDADRATALKALTDLYDLFFKTPLAKKISAFRRNEISLFLYTGPIGSVELLSATVKIPRRGMHAQVGQVPGGWLNTDRFGQMLTGDGFLHSKQRLDDFERFYNVGSRLKRGAVFQVMHHGSKSNWRRGIATLIQPVVSVYCSDPLGKWEHPNTQVMEDFASYFPVQVDGVHGWQVEGTYRFL